MTAMFANASIVASSIWPFTNFYGAVFHEKAVYRFFPSFTRISSTNPARCRLPQIDVTDSACHAWDLGIVEPGWQDLLFFSNQSSRLCVAAFVFRPCLFNVLGRNEHHHVL